MPYIHPDNRKILERGYKPATVGELNYAITMLILSFMNAAPFRGYTGYNEVMGVLECVKQEFYRRAVVPYEDRKAEEHGDLPWPTN